MRLAPCLLALLLAVPSLVAADGFRLPGEALRPDLEGTVVRVLDGDTLDIELGDGSRQRIRLAEIDAPERGQPWSKVATDYLRQLVLEQTVRVIWFDEQPPRGRSPGRIIGHIWLDELDVNRAMVEQGLAWAFDGFLRDMSLCATEEAARTARRGLWRAPREQWLPPWVQRAKAANRDPAWVARCPRPDLRQP